jgi:hypothetical protein
MFYYVIYYIILYYIILKYINFKVKEPEGGYHLLK